MSLTLAPPTMSLPPVYTHRHLPPAIRARIVRLILLHWRPDAIA